MESHVVLSEILLEWIGKEEAILAKYSGITTFGKETKGKVRLVITDDNGEAHEELIPKIRTLNIFEGAFVSMNLLKIVIILLDT